MISSETLVHYVCNKFTSVSVRMRHFERMYIPTLWNDIVVLFFLLLMANSVTPKHFAEWDVGRLRSVRNVRMEERIFETAERQSAVSTRRLVVRTGISYASVQYMHIRCRHLPHCVCARVSTTWLTHTKCSLTVQFSAVGRGQYVHMKALFTDESCSARTGVAIIHSECL